jgi:hypothetical protein
MTKGFIMVEAGALRGPVAAAGTDKVWDQWPGEPELWYGRFEVYLALGPTRSVSATARALAADPGRQKHWSDGRWSGIARQWFWRERAHAWDVHQRELLAFSERNRRLALRDRRIELIEDQLDVVCELLDTANLTAVDEQQARAWLPQMRVFLLDLLTAERKEFERGDYERDDPANHLTITADDLRAAQRAYEAQAGPGQTERPELARLPRCPAKPAVNYFPAGHTLLVCNGQDGTLHLDQAALCAVRSATGLKFMRVLDVTQRKFAETLRRERSLGRPVELLHMALRATPAGIEFVDGLADGSWLSQRLPGVRILLLAAWEGDGAGDWLKVMPHVITLRAGISHEDAAVLTQRFWHNIGLGLEPGQALDEALAHCSPAAGEFVARYW